MPPNAPARCLDVCSPERPVAPDDYEVGRPAHAKKLFDGLIRNYTMMDAGRRTFRLAWQDRLKLPQSALSILMIGDSTMRNQCQALCLALDDAVFSSWEHTPGKGTNPDTGFLCDCAGRLGATRISASYLEALDFHDETAGLRAQQLRRTADVVYFGLGQWLMWPVPYANSPEQFWLTLSDWLDYGTELSESVLSYRRQGKLVVASTLHDYCTHPEETRQHATLYPACVAYARAHAPRVLAKQHITGEWTPERLCTTGERRTAGSAHLSQRTRAVVLHAADPGVRLVDAFNLTRGRCDATLPGDNLHFHGTIYEELGLLFGEIEAGLEAGKAAASSGGGGGVPPHVELVQRVRSRRGLSCWPLTR